MNGVIFTTYDQIYDCSLRVHKTKILRGDLLREEQEGFWWALVSYAWLYLLSPLTCLLLGPGSQVRGGRVDAREPWGTICESGNTAMEWLGRIGLVIAVMAYQKQ